MRVLDSNWDIIRKIGENSNETGDKLLFALDFFNCMNTFELNKVDRQKLLKYVEDFIDNI